jgi:hypothetical protein
LSNGLSLLVCVKAIASKDHSNLPSKHWWLDALFARTVIGTADAELVVKPSAQ